MSHQVNLHTIKLKKDDRRPFLTTTLLDKDLAAVDITGSTIAFFMRNLETGIIKINGTAGVITNATGGEFEYRWAAIDTDTVGRFSAEFKVTFGDGTVLSVPRAVDLRIEVREDVK